MSFNEQTLNQAFSETIEPQFMELVAKKKYKSARALLDEFYQHRGEEKDFFYWDKVLSIHLAQLRRNENTAEWNFTLLDKDLEKLGEMLKRGLANGTLTPKEQDLYDADRDVVENLRAMSKTGVPGEGGDQAVIAATRPQEASFAPQPQPYNPASPQQPPYEGGPQPHPYNPAPPQQPPYEGVPQPQPYNPAPPQQAPYEGAPQPQPYNPAPPQQPPYEGGPQPQPFNPGTQPQPYNGPAPQFNQPGYSSSNHQGSYGSNSSNKSWIFILVGFAAVALIVFFVFRFFATDGGGEKADSIGSEYYYDDEVYPEEAPQYESSLPDYDWLSYRLATYADISDLNSEELRIMRNYIFARHGYIFKSPDLTEYFSQYPWYDPRYTNVTADLNETELKNIDFIKRYE